MVTFAIIIIMCRVQWQQHFLACLAGSSGNWGLASLLWPHLTETVVFQAISFSVPSFPYLSQLRWLCKYKNLEQNVRNFMSFQFANCPQQIGHGSATHVCHELFLIVISICLLFPHTPSLFISPAPFFLNSNSVNATMMNGKKGNGLRDSVNWNMNI